MGRERVDPELGRADLVQEVEVVAAQAGVAARERAEVCGRPASLLAEAAEAREQKLRQEVEEAGEEVEAEAEVVVEVAADSAAEAGGAEAAVG